MRSPYFLRFPKEGSFVEFSTRDQLSKRSLLAAEAMRNKINHIPVGRTQDDCPKRVAYLNELAEQRRRKLR